MKTLLKQINSKKLIRNPKSISSIFSYLKGINKLFESDKNNTRKVFIDCGGMDGCSIRFFRESYPNAKQFSIYSFEPNPIFSDYYRKLKNVAFFNKAVWIYDGYIDFYLSNSEFKDGSTLIKGKNTGELDKSHPIKVKCIDLSKWILETFIKEDYIILKMDIEGAEYEVLKKMFHDKSIDYIDELFIEFHWNRINITEAEHLEMISELEKANIHVAEWAAMPHEREQDKRLIKS